MPEHTDDEFSNKYKVLTISRHEPEKEDETLWLFSPANGGGGGHSTVTASVKILKIPTVSLDFIEHSDVFHITHIDKCFIISV